MKHSGVRSTVGHVTPVDDAFFEGYEDASECQDVVDKNIVHYITESANNIIGESCGFREPFDVFDGQEMSGGNRRAGLDMTWWMSSRKSGSRSILS